MKYAELHCKTNYSFLSGASHPDELVQRAVELGYEALAITDENSLAGVVRAWAAARNTELKLLIGSEIIPVDGAKIVVWATDRKSYGKLSKLITTGRGRVPKGECEIYVEDIAKFSDGLMAGIVPNLNVQDEHGQSEHLEKSLSDYRDIFGDRCYLLAELFRGPDDQKRIAQLLNLSARSKLPLVAAGDVHYHSDQRMLLRNVLTAIRNGTKVSNSGDLLLTNAQRHLQQIDERIETFRDIPGAMERTIEIANRCTFKLDELRYEYPEELAPAGKTQSEYLKELAWKGAAKRYPNGVPEKVANLIQHELRLIKEMRYEAYFLTVWDLVRFARGRKILCQGRGSAANSAVCYCLGVTSVDPAKTDLLFERFISKERNEAPDIDVDFEHERREEVLQYLYEKYGRDRAGLAATVITYRSRSAVRDVGKALGLSLDRVDALAKQVDGYANVSDLASRCTEVGIDPQSRIGKQLIFLTGEILGFPRHLSQHVGGMVMTQGSLCELVPIENAAMENRTVIQWDKEDLEELGVLKVDCLSLGMLSAIRKCFALIGEFYNRELTLANIPPDDQPTYDMICKAETMGVFQIESRAQMSMLPRLKPRNYYDLVIEVALVRPGPIQGNMVHPFLRRRSGEEKVIYPNDEIKKVLEKTLGVPIFQEQAMKLAVVAAGFTPGEADQLRRAMGAWRKTGVIEKFREKLYAGMRAKGLPDEFADQVFRQIRGFGEYGFPESHAASFALLVYVSAFLKKYYPAVFCASLVNSQPMGFYAPAQLIGEARDNGVQIREIDVNFSDWDCRLEPVEFGMQDLGEQDSSGLNPSQLIAPKRSTAEKNSLDKQSQMNQSVDPFRPTSSENQRYAIRLGFRLINGLAAEVGEVIMKAQRDGPFESMSDFTRRTGLSRATITKLSGADAFQSLKQDRRNALWQALSQEKKRVDQPLFGELGNDDEPLIELPEMDAREEVYADYHSFGMSLKAHPISFYRDQLEQVKVTKIGDLPQRKNNQYVRVAGLVLLRQRPSTAKGVTFVTIEDESGTANLVLFQDTWDRNYKIARRASAWIAHGKLEQKDGVLHVIVSRLEDMSEQLSKLNTKSRDFR